MVAQHCTYLPMDTFENSFRSGNLILTALVILKIFHENLSLRARLKDALTSTTLLQRSASRSIVP